MILGLVGEQSNEDFSVVDESNDLVSSLDSTAFTAHLFDPAGSISSIGVNISELGHGHYRASFIPSSIGMWMLIVYHSAYFPTGKSGSIQVFANDFDSITTLVTRILGLTQENFYIDNTSYDSNNNLTQSRIRIYSDEISVGTANDVIATYNMTSTFDGNGNMTDYTVKKV